MDWPGPFRLVVVLSEIDFAAFHTDALLVVSRHMVVLLFYY